MVSGGLVEPVGGVVEKLVHVVAVDEDDSAMLSVRVVHTVDVIADGLFAALEVLCGLFDGHVVTLTRVHRQGSFTVFGHEKTPTLCAVGAGLT